MVDYAALLKKYIAYIADCEGIDYIEPIDLRDSSDVIFTEAEWEALQAIHDEQARARRHEPRLRRYGRYRTTHQRHLRLPMCRGRTTTMNKQASTPRTVFKSGPELDAAVTRTVMC
jgi:hypothetical protein